MQVTCDVCSREFTPARSDARYCSGRCRTIAYRRRTEPDRTPAKRRPLPDVIRDRSSDLARIAASLERCGEDDRLARLLKANAVQRQGRMIRMEAERLLRIAERLDPS